MSYFTPNANAVDPLSFIDQGGVPNRAIGELHSVLADTLFTGNSTAGAWITSRYIHGANQIILFLSSTGGANTVTVEVSPDNVNWYYAVNAVTGAAVSVSLTDASDPTAPAAASTAVVSILPAPYYRIKFSAVENVRAQHLLRF